MIHEFLHILTNPAHWGFEIVSDLAIGGVMWPLAKRAVRRHDRESHRGN